MFGAVDVDLLRNLAIALVLGALVGVERERKHGGEPTLFGGIRTFSLLALAGGASAWLSLAIGSMAPFVAIGVAIAALLVASYLATSAREEVFGITTEVAAVVVFLLGATSGFGHPEVAVPLAIVTAGLLALKDPLHQAVQKLGRDDIEAGLKLLFATFIVLPLLPDRPVDPWGALNPYKLWWLVILISALSLVGYVAVRVLGSTRGTALTGLLAGLVSSTAATLSFARRSQAEPQVDAFAIGILLAWAVMFARVLVVAAVANPALLATLAVPVGALGVATLIVAGVVFLRRSAEAPAASDAVPLSNPFSLGEAVKFGAWFAVILLVVELAERGLSTEAMYGIAAIAGATDVDAITLSMARSSADDPVTLRVASTCIVIAVLSNTLVKAGMAAWWGAPGLRNRVGAAAIVLCVVAAGALGIGAFVA